MLAALALVLALTGAAAGVEPCDAGYVAVDAGIGTPEQDLLRSAASFGAPGLAPGAVRRGGAQLRCGDATALPWRLRAVGDDALSGPTLRAVPVRLDGVFDSTLPSGGNDGLLWAGRGVSGMLSGGIAFRWGALSAALAPEVAASANEPFDTVPVAPGAPAYSNPYYGDAIDLPQRFSSSPFAEWSLGQSYVRADAWNVAVGFSTENLWFGPGIRNSLTMSNAGPGFPHVFVGTSRPGDVRIGRAEAFAFWGQLSRSDEYVHDARPLIGGLVLAFSPAFEPHLSMGLSRVFVQTWELSWSTLFAPLQSLEKEDLAGDNPDDNQILSLFARWAHPQAGFEVHVEWGREDHEADFDNAIKEPDHSQAYLLGLEKVWRAGSRRVRLQAELTHLQEQRPLENSRGVPVWYTHGRNLSYTQRGQLLGAWIGPGGDSQTLTVDVFSASGRIGGFLERVRRNDAYYWAVIEPGGGTPEHDVELGGGLRGVLRKRGVELTWEAGLSKRWNRDWLGTDWNWRLALGLAFPVALPAPP